jgi:DNA-binding PadR family transcriptional regulator
MPKSKHDPQAVLPLTLPVFHMLLSLAEGERHGYALKREILKRTGGKLNLGSGALYGAINKMLELELIEESEERPDPHLDDERRRYYRITPFGLCVVQEEAVRLRALVHFAEERLQLPDPA